MHPPSQWLCITGGADGDHIHHAFTNFASGKESDSNEFKTHLFCPKFKREEFANNLLVFLYH